MSSSTHHVTIVTSNNNLDVPRTVRSRRASDTASIRSEAPPYTPSLHAAHTPQPPPRRSPHTAAGPSAAAPNDSNALAPTTALTSSSAATAPHGRTLSIEPPPYSPSTEDPPAYAPHPKPPQTPEAFTFRKFIHIMASALVTLDMFLCIFLVFVSGGMMLYSGIDHTIFPIAIPIMFAVTACFGRIGLTYENNSAVLFYIGIYSIRWLADAVAVLYLGRPFLGYGTGSLPSSSRGNNIPPPSPSSLPYPYPSPPAASNGPQFGFHMSLFAVSFTTILPGIRGVQPLIMPCYDNMRFTDDCPMWSCGTACRLTLPRSSCSWSCCIWDASSS
ncbi:hypothetical protein BC831DRAFT_199206 [Entophlyctis helioformis]|nr:hypothetical protein BC831DRAFT_199206 [Entophlyctis helioformis]